MLARDTLMVKFLCHEKKESEPPHERDCVHAAVLLLNRIFVFLENTIEIYPCSVLY